MKIPITSSIYNNVVLIATRMHIAKKERIITIKKSEKKPKRKIF
jgi:hypothetical protein